jgi:hypothetical protein
VATAIPATGVAREYALECWIHFVHGNRCQSTQIPGSEILMAEVKRTRRNTLERRCLGKAFKRLFVRSPKGVFKMLEKVKRA